MRRARHPHGARGGARLLLFLLTGLIGMSAGAPVEAKVFLTSEEALKLAFPGAKIERRTVFLSEVQVARAQKLAGGEAPAPLVHPYVATRDVAVIGTAYFDSHLVRTLSETLMVIVDSLGKVARVEVLVFNEPDNYLPRAAWYGQYSGRGLDSELALQRAIRGVTGATLTARATTQAVRRVLAVHQVIAEMDRQ